MKDNNFMPASIQTILKTAPVIPVLVIRDIKSAVPMARALVAGGLSVLEITLRTPVAAEAIRQIIQEVDGAIVGVGTVLTKQQVELCEELHCAFMVSPGSTPALRYAATQSEIPLLAGVSTPSEAMILADDGFDCLKFYPAEANGGVAVLKAWAGPLPHLMFCPTGGVTLQNATDYLALPNVVCVGGSWVTPDDAVESCDWKRIESLASDAAGLQSQSVRR